MQDLSDIPLVPCMILFAGLACPILLTLDGLGFSSTLSLISFTWLVGISMLT